MSFGSLIVGAFLHGRPSWRWLVSLKSRRSIDKAGPDEHDEFIVTFRKEADKTFTKVVKKLSRDWKTGGIKEMKRDKPVEDGPFELTNDPSDYDEKVEYQDFDGETKFMYFKRIAEENE
jgi:hypothetical protein